MRFKSKAVLMLGTVLFTVMLASLFLMTKATQNSEMFGKLYSYLLAINTSSLLILLTLIGLNIRHLFRQVRNREPGSLLTTRLVILITILVTTPVSIVYYFSLGFLQRGIDSWFDMRIEQALEGSLELSRLALDTRMRELLLEARKLVSQISELPDAAVPREIDKLRENAGAVELVLLNAQGNLISSSSSDPTSLVPHRPDDSLWLQLSKENSYIGLDQIGEEGIFIRAALNVPSAQLDEKERIVQLLFPVSERMNDLAGNIQTDFLKYKKLSYLRSKLKLSFIMTLTLVLLFSIFSSVWAIFFTARKITAPIQTLAQGTRAVSEGNYGMELQVASRDELGMLILSFNEMTQKLAQARQQAADSQQKAEAQSAYLETVLSQISSGVLVLDPEYKLRIFNVRACQNLGIALHSEDQGCTLEELGKRYPRLASLATAIHESTRQNRVWQDQLVYVGERGKRILHCSGTTFSYPYEREASHIIVLDDVTALIQSERDTAWAEIARRMAHEIKNPLTPIQLAAERLRHKYRKLMISNKPTLLDRLTNTIIQQVGTMRDMVDSFHDYASPPRYQPKFMDVNKLVLETLELYRNTQDNIHVRTDLPPLPLIKADTDRLRRVLNNLLNNALEANRGEDVLELQVSTRYSHEEDGPCVTLQIRDSGGGFAHENLERIFEPYATTRGKGHGLGLPIVKKLVEDHGGSVQLENNVPPPGALVTVRLPAAETQDAGTVYGKDQPHSSESPAAADAQTETAT